MKLEANLKGSKLSRANLISGERNRLQDMLSSLQESIVSKREENQLISAQLSRAVSPNKFKRKTSTSDLEEGS